VKQTLGCLFDDFDGNTNLHGGAKLRQEGRNAYPISHEENYQKEHDRESTNDKRDDLDGLDLVLVGGGLRGDHFD
jgi:hypothetical protein